MSRSLVLILIAVLLGALSATACGGRSPLATNLYDDPDLVGGGAGVGGTGGIGGTGGTGGTGVAGEGGGTAGTGGVGGVGASGGTGGTGGSLPVECFACMAAQCPDALACVMDSNCIQGLLCAASQCMGGGGMPDIGCMLDCFDGDIQAAIDAGLAIMCVFQNCGDECGSMLPMSEG